MGLREFSLSNLTNSLAEVLAEKLLEAGYLVYWHSLDALQTADAVYPEYQANQASVLLDESVAEQFANSRGVITLRNADFSFPQFPTRPTTDGAVVASEDVAVPTIVLQVQHQGHGRLLGLGTRERNRYASLDVYGLARDQGEQLYLADTLRVAFDESQFIPVEDHDAGTRAAVGSLEIQGSGVGTFIYPLGPESMAFEFTLDARLRYEA
jgi:hypothetical protein